MTVVTEKTKNTLPIGYQLQDYCIQSILGEGEFAINYLAQDTKTNTQVALKEYFPKELAFRENSYNVQHHSQRYEDHFAWGLERFLEEGQTLANFQHPNIVRVLRCFEAHYTGYIVMEYEFGESLLSILKRKERSRESLSEAEIMIFLPPLLEGLQAVHDAGFLHQDIKPESLYLRDKNQTPVLLGFGAARYALASLLGRMTTITTPGYAPFEQYQKGHQGPWTDIYALGAVLYRVIGSRSPIEVLERIDIIKRRYQPDPLVPAIDLGHKHYSKPLLKGIDWALQIAEEDRPQTVKQWSQALWPKKRQNKFNSSQFYQSVILPIKQFNKWLLASLVLLLGFSVGYMFYKEQAFSDLQQENQVLQILQKQIDAEKNRLEQALEDRKKQLQEAHQVIETKQELFTELENEHIVLQQILEKKEWQLQKTLRQKERLERKKAGEIIQDRIANGEYGPDMVWIPKGRFLMGDIQGKGERHEQPVHWVTLKGFAIGRYEVTFAEYDRFAEMTHRKKPSDNGWGRGKRPVINVSWHDAIAYAQWLTQQTGHQYRLPTEAEWEYAARGGSVTQYWWGDEIDFKHEHCYNCNNEWAGQKTMPVGYFSPNPFGLHDIAGNVREWTCSKYQEKYTGKEQDCVTEVALGDRVERGGAWSHRGKEMRVSSRQKSLPEAEYSNVGFRLVREL
jgi:formylglycine-generating enzyme required for sulfatase activity